MISADRLASACILCLPILCASTGAVAAQERARSGSADEAITIVACVARETEYVQPVPAAPASAGEPQMLLTERDSAAALYSVTGVQEPQLAAHVGRRVEVTGTTEPPRTTAVLTTVEGTRTGSVNTDAVGATGVTPDGSAAHEPSDALPDTVKAGPVPEATRGISDPAGRIATLPRLNVKAFRVVAGDCVRPAATTTSGVSDAPRRAPALTPAVAQPQRVTVRGCLVRRTASGTALTTQRTPGDPLALTNASMAAEQIPAASGETPPPAPMSFALTGIPATEPELARRVGEHVEITGTLYDEQPTPGPAHPSAPTRVITVTAYRPLGGVCR